MESIDLTTPQYDQPRVLAVTRLKPTVLQTWINRSIIKLAKQNPGYGRRRLYSAIDVVKLSIMRRLADFRIDLSISTNIAEAVEAELVKKGEWPWDQYLFMQGDIATEKTINIELQSISSGTQSPLYLKYGARYCDPAQVRVAEIVEPDKHMAPRRDHLGITNYDSIWDQPVVESKRDKFAREGIHAEPTLIFPLGEIINGALLHLEALKERDTLDADGSKTK